MKTLSRGCAVYVNESKTTPTRSAPGQTSLDALLGYIAGARFIGIKQRGNTGAVKGYRER
jgi:hypothetical protein